jgi:hypothetical protein
MLREFTAKLQRGESKGAWTCTVTVRIDERLN